MLRELVGHGGPVRSVASTPDGKRIVTGSDDHMVRMFDALSGEFITAFDQGSGVLSVAVSANRVVAGSDDGIARVWDETTGTVFPLLPKHSGPINSVAISADGRMVVT